MQCASCGSTSPPTAAFCATCGAALSPVPGPAPGWGATPTPGAAPGDESGQRVIAVPDLLSTAPDWLTKGWAGPVSLAVVAVVLGLVFQYLAGLFVDAGVLVGREPGTRFPWGDLFRQPADVWLGFHGGINGTPITVTGLCWIAIGFVVARKIVFPYFPVSRRQPVDASARKEVLASALKTAIAYMAVVVIVSVVANALRNKNDFGAINGTSLPAFYALGGTGFLGRTNLAASIFISLIVSAVVAFVIFARSAGGSVFDVIGLPVRFRIPDRFGAIWSGTKRTLFIGGAGLLVFLYLAFLLDLGTDHQGITGKGLASEALLLFPSTIIWNGVDVGLTGFIVSMRFFLGEHQVVPSGKPGWVYAAVLITAAAFLFGGMAAARKSTHTDGMSAVRTAAATALVVAGICFLFALFHVSNPGSGGLIASGLFLPLLWALVAAVGGFIYANQHGLPLGVTVTFPNRTGTATAPTAGSPPQPGVVGNAPAPGPGGYGPPPVPGGYGPPPPPPGGFGPPPPAPPGGFGPPPAPPRGYGPPPAPPRGYGPPPAPGGYGPPPPGYGPPPAGPYRPPGSADTSPPTLVVPTVDSSPTLVVPAVGPPAPASPPPGTTATPFSTCERCGKANEPDREFCSCGARLT